MRLSSRRLGPYISARSASRLSAALQRGAPIDIHSEVEDALATGKPVVALETALTTHGLPPPINLQVTRELETIVRSTGCVPATIGFLAGRVKIGLENLDIERLADVDRNPRAVKISRRDIAPALALNCDGGTTISATLIFAALAGIKVYVFTYCTTPVSPPSAGCCNRRVRMTFCWLFTLTSISLGGVHRGGETSMDISADLHELTRCPVGLVSAGIKSILDIGRTLEYLETLGVPVIPYGKTKDFPAFFSPRSGLQSPWNASDPKTAAKMLYNQWQLGMENGVLIAVPIPEEYAAKGELIQWAVNQAVRESEENGMSKRGKEVTPWLLSRVAELTKHDSIDSNIALLKNTALIGGQIAVQYQDLASQTIPTDKTYVIDIGSASRARDDETLTAAKVMVVGSAALDISAQAEDMANAAGSTIPGTVSLGLGGVARNIAEACHRLGEPALLVSPIGRDTWGGLLHEETKAIGMRTDGFILQADERTAVCNLFLDGTGSLVSGVADMDITSKLDVNLVLAQIAKHNPQIVAMDGNLSSGVIQTVLDHCIQRNIQVLFEPSSITKSEKILPAVELSLRKGSPPLSFFTPNLLELKHVYRKASEDGGLTSSAAWWSAIDRLSLNEVFRMDLAQLAKQTVRDDEKEAGTANSLAFLVEEGVAQMAVTLTPFFQHMFIKCGERGVLAVIRLSGTYASAWSNVRSNPGRRCVVAHGGNEILVVQHFPPHRTDVINSTGAGDSFVGALLASVAQGPHPLSDPMTLDRLVATCQSASCLTLQSHSSVSPLLHTLIK
ncbi:indigoidine synthase A-like protein [Mycena pura]|uniref:Indigoidine synthase A-like protein n=1 Tax=Mycena pura TaxID=153505 RepID=A0AAD6YPC4_9AGAR|nr:indigoidine synthase A-like protein [Mycena pura]